MGNIDQLDEVVRIYRIDEVIFCSKDVRSQEILAWMTRLGPAISYKIIPEESMSIIGSSSKDEPGELYTIEIRYNIAQPGQRRNKRVLDLSICLFLLLALPIGVFFRGKMQTALKNWWAVFAGKKTWVGYAESKQNVALPAIKPGVFSPLDGFKGLKINKLAVDRLNFLYAKDWNVWRDIDIMLSRQ